MTPLALACFVLALALASGLCVFALLEWER